MLASDAAQFVKGAETIERLFRQSEQSKVPNAFSEGFLKDAKLVYYKTQLDRFANQGLDVSLASTLLKNLEVKPFKNIKEMQAAETRLEQSIELAKIEKNIDLLERLIEHPPIAQDSMINGKSIIDTASLDKARKEFENLKSRLKQGETLNQDNIDNVLRLTQKALTGKTREDYQASLRQEREEAQRREVSPATRGNKLLAWFGKMISPNAAEASIPPDITKETEGPKNIKQDLPSFFKPTGKPINLETARALAGKIMLDYPLRGVKSYVGPHGRYAYQRKTHYHRAIDLMAPLGTGVYPPGEGWKVKFSRDRTVFKKTDDGRTVESGYGNLVTIEKYFPEIGKWIYISFSHLDTKIDPAMEGKMVGPDVCIGTVGATGTTQIRSAGVGCLDTRMVASDKPLTAYGQLYDYSLFVELDPETVMRIKPGTESSSSAVAQSVPARFTKRLIQLASIIPPFSGLVATDVPEFTVRTDLEDFEDFDNVGIESSKLEVSKPEPTKSEVVKQGPSKPITEKPKQEGQYNVVKVKRSGQALWNIIEDLGGNPLQWRTIVKLHNEYVDKHNASNPRNRLRKITIKGKTDDIAIIVPGQLLFLALEAIKKTGQPKEGKIPVTQKLTQEEKVKSTNKTVVSSYKQTDKQISRETDKQTVQRLDPNAGLLMRKPDITALLATLTKSEKQAKEDLENIKDPVLKAKKVKESAKVTELKGKLQAALASYNALVKTYEGYRREYLKLKEGKMKAEQFLGVKKAVLDVNTVLEVKWQHGVLKKDEAFRLSEIAFIEKGLKDLENKIKEIDEGLSNIGDDGQWTNITKKGIEELGTQIVETQRDIASAKDKISSLGTSLTTWQEALAKLQAGEDTNIDELIGTVQQSDKASAELKKTLYEADLVQLSEERQRLKIDADRTLIITQSDIDETNREVQKAKEDIVKLEAMLSDPKKRAGIDPFIAERKVIEYRLNTYWPAQISWAKADITYLTNRLKLPLTDTEKANINKQIENLRDKINYGTKVIEGLKLDLLLQSRVVPRNLIVKAPGESGKGVLDGIQYEKWSMLFEGKVSLTQDSIKFAKNFPELIDSADLPDNVKDELKALWDKYYVSGPEENIEDLINRKIQEANQAIDYFNKTLPVIKAMRDFQNVSYKEGLDHWQEEITKAQASITKQEAIRASLKEQLAKDPDNQALIIRLQITEDQIANLRYFQIPFYESSLENIRQNQQYMSSNGGDRYTVIKRFEDLTKLNIALQKDTVDLLDEILKNYGSIIDLGKDYWKTEKTDFTARLTDVNKFIPIILLG